MADVLKSHRHSSSDDRRQTLLRYVALYNHHLPQSALGAKTPMQAMKDGTSPTHTSSTKDLPIVRDATAKHAKTPAQARTRMPQTV